MAATTRSRETPPWMDDGTGRSEAELALREGATLLGGALIGLLHAADVVLEAWPLPASRARKDRAR